MKDVIPATVILLVSIVLTWCIMGLLISPSMSSKPIKIETPLPVAVHPISNELSSGYLLVQIWTENESHIVRMKRSEYIEWMNQGSF